MLKIEQKKFVHIRWLDSRGVYDRWQRLSEIDEREEVDVLEIDSVGFIIREDHVGLHLAGHVGFDGEHTQFIGDMQIPKAAILSRKEFSI